MKCIVLIALFLSCKLCAFVSETQYENDQVHVAKITISPYEKIGVHRDEYPHLVIALNDGIITRIEDDGRVVDVYFPKNRAVFRPIDLSLHNSFNKSAEPLELIIIRLKK